MRFYGPLGALIVGIGVIGAYPVYADGSGSPEVCKTGASVEGDENVLSYTAQSGTVSAVCIKSGSKMFGGTGHSGPLQNVSDGCYTITGVGTSSVTVRRTGDGPNCQGLSHIDVIVQRATPSPIATAVSSATVVPSPNATAVGSATVTGSPTATASASPTQGGQGKIQVHKYVWTGSHWQNQGIGQGTFWFNVHLNGQLVATGSQLHPIDVPHGTLHVTEQATAGFSFAGFFVPEHGNAGCQNRPMDGPFSASAVVDVSGHGVVHVCAYNFVATPTASPTATAVGTATLTPSPTVTATLGTPTVTATSGTPTVTATLGTPTVTATASPSATAIGSATVTPSPSVTPTEGTPTVTPTEGTPTVTPTEGTPTVTPTEGTPTVTPTEGTPTVTATLGTATVTATEAGVTTTATATTTSAVSDQAPQTNTAQPTQGQQGQQGQQHPIQGQQGQQQPIQRQQGQQQATPQAPSTGSGTAVTSGERMMLGLGIVFVIAGLGAMLSLRRNR